MTHGRQRKMTTSIQNEQGIHPAAGLQGLTPDVCHDVLATIRHGQRWQAIARVFLSFLATGVALFVFHFASSLTYVAALTCVPIFFSLSHFILAAQHGREAKTVWTSILRFFLRPGSSS